MFTRRFFQVVAVVVLLAGVPGIARSQDAFERAKTLYLEAAYEDALALLDTPGPGGTADVHLYRALCLLALGRSSEADAAIARSIEADPLATVARQDVSPRVASLLAEARRRMLPEMARRRVADGRLAYQQGDRAGATQRFEAAIRLLDDPTLANQSELTDLKTLASGFLESDPRAECAADGCRGPPATATAAPAPSAAPAPAPQRRRPASSAAPARRPALSRPARMLPLRQPCRGRRCCRRPCRHGARRTRRGEPATLRGSLLLAIDATGRVTNAAMQQQRVPRLRSPAARSGARLAIHARDAGRSADAVAVGRADRHPTVPVPIGRVRIGAPLHAPQPRDASVRSPELQNEGPPFADIAPPSHRARAFP